MDPKNTIFTGPKPTINYLLSRARSNGNITASDLVHINSEELQKQDKNGNNLLDHSIMRGNIDLFKLVLNKSVDTDNVLMAIFKQATDKVFLQGAVDACLQESGIEIRLDDLRDYEKNNTVRANALCFAAEIEKLAQKDILNKSVSHSM